MAAKANFEYFFFGRFGAYEEYYAFGLTRDDCKEVLWRMYERNCERNGYEITEEDKQTFEEEVYISEFHNFNILNGFGFNTLDNGERVYKVIERGINPTERALVTATESRGRG